MTGAFLGTGRTRRVLGIALLLLVAASVVAGRETIAPARMHAAPLEAKPQSTLGLDLVKLRRPEAEALRADPFAQRSFAPAPVARASEAPPPPSAPPLPFRYFGTLTQDGKTEVFVMRGEELISIAAGDKIDAEYRVEEVSESRIAFTYLPLKVRQTLQLGEAGA